MTAIIYEKGDMRVLANIFSVSMSAEGGKYIIKYKSSEDGDIHKLSYVYRPRIDVLDN